MGMAGNEVVVLSCLRNEAGLVLLPGLKESSATGKLVLLVLLMLPLA